MICSAVTFFLVASLALPWFVPRKILSLKVVPFKGGRLGGGSDDGGSGGAVGSTGTGAAAFLRPGLASCPCSTCHYATRRCYFGRASWESHGPR